MSVKVMSRVWDESKQSGAALLVLLAIADVGDDNGVAYPGVATLAKRARTSERNVPIVCDKLVEAGELAVERNSGPHGCNVYRVLLGGGENSSGVKILRGENSSGVKILQGSASAESGAVTPVVGGENSSGVKILHPKVGRLGIDPLPAVESEPNLTLPAVIADPAPAVAQAQTPALAQSGGVNGAAALAAHRGYVAFDPHNSAPLSADAERSFALLTDREVGIDPIMARRLAEGWAFDEIARQVFQARRDIAAGSLRSFGVLNHRLLARTSAVITSVDRQSALYLRHCESPFAVEVESASDEDFRRSADEARAQRAALEVAGRTAGDPDLVQALGGEWDASVARIERAGEVDGVPLVRVVLRDGTRSTWFERKGIVPIRRRIHYSLGFVPLMEVAA